MFLINSLLYIYNCWFKNKKYSIRKFYKHPGIEAHEHGDLVLFKYKRDYWYQVNWDPNLDWDDISKAARGIVFNRKTGELLAKPYDKFFNLNQSEETKIENLPKGPFTATKKIDGCLAISYFYKGELCIASSGSLKYDISTWATEWARKNLNVLGFIPGYTYIFEVVHPKFKIVIDYGEEENLILTGAKCIDTNKEVSYEQLMHMANMIDCDITPAYFFQSIEEVIEECKELPYTEEGYVLTYPNGLKVKVKSQAYCDVHKMIENLTPLTFWRAWDCKTREAPKDIAADLPDEFKEEIDALFRGVDNVHKGYAERIILLYNKILGELGEDCDNRVFHPYCKKNYPGEYGLLSEYHRKNMDRFWYYVHKKVRPTENEWPDVNEI
jgi:hypothetical protein